jgi:integrase
VVHHEQQVRGKDPYQPGKINHNKEFTERCEKFGPHPKLGEGYHLRPADGVFREFMKELGIHPAEDAAKAPMDPDMDWFRWLIKYKGQERKGNSPLKKWCSPECEMNVRMGIFSNPGFMHHICATLHTSVLNTHPRVVQSLLGHSSWNLTMDTYAHVMPAIQEDAAEIMDKFLEDV